MAPVTLQEQSQPAELLVEDLLLVQSLSLPSCDVNTSNLWAQGPQLLCHLWNKQFQCKCPCQAALQESENVPVDKAV